MSLYFCDFSALLRGQYSVMSTRGFDPGKHSHADVIPVVNTVFILLARQSVL